MKKNLFFLPVLFSMVIGFILKFSLSASFSISSIAILETIFILLVSCSIIIALISSKDLSFFSPGAFFSISMFSFVLIRPIMRIFGDIDVVQAGVSINQETIANAIFVLGMGCLIIAISYILSENKAMKLAKGFNFDISVPFLINPARVSYQAYLGLGLVFLILSFKKSADLGQLSYFELTERPEFYAHLYLFFIGKILFLFYLLFGKAKTTKLPMVFFILFVFSLGFVLLGLRGYTVVYLFVFLYFYDAFYKIKVMYIALLMSCLLLVSTFVLELRIGYSVTDGFFNMLLFPFYTQGATFEVVFGAVNFHDELLKCLPYTKFFSGDHDFGACVDSARGVGFVSGGFASSFFAEAFYLGWFPYIALCIAFGCCARFLDCISFYLKELIKEKKEVPPGYIFIILYTLANVLYFSRSGVFDFIVKVPAIFFILLTVVWIKNSIRLSKGVSK